MDSRSYIRLTGNLLNQAITGTTGTTNISSTYIPPLKTCFLNIGSWDMSAGCAAHGSRTINIPSSIKICKIRSVDAHIYTNNGANGDAFSFEATNSDWEVSGRIRVDSANCQIELIRNATGLFCQSSFNSSIGNRGVVGITYSNIQPPSGNTGVLANLASTCFNVEGNSVINDGGSPITEYGVVWSQNYSTPTISNGVRVCTCASIANNQQFTKSLTGLNDGTMTYFRMYARNCEEVGYGIVKCCATPAMPLPTEVTLSVNADPARTYNNQSAGTIDLDTPLGTGQWICFTAYYDQCAPTNGDMAQINFYCKACGSSYFTPINYLIDPTYNLCTTYYRDSGWGYGAPVICINKGDCICWENCAFYNSGTYSCFNLYPHTSSSGLSVSIAPYPNDMNCVCNQ